MKITKKQLDKLIEQRVQKILSEKYENKDVIQVLKIDNLPITFDLVKHDIQNAIKNYGKDLFDSQKNLKLRIEQLDNINVALTHLMEKTHPIMKEIEIAKKEFENELKKSK